MFELQIAIEKRSVGVGQKNYYLPEGYRCNAPITLDHDEAVAYWTAERIALSAFYQHHVYLLAAHVVARHRCLTAIDLGCGPATKARMLIDAGIERLVLIDQASSENVIRAAMPNAEFFPINLETLEPQADITGITEHFDLIVCADVIEHLSDPFPCLNFVFSHLNPSGVAIFSTPERDILRGRHCMVSPNQAHVREWTRGEFEILLKSAGFIIHQHYNLPPRRLALLEEFLRKALQSFFCVTRWHACQVAICGKKQTGV